MLSWQHNSQTFNNTFSNVLSLFTATIKCIVSVAKMKIKLIVKEKDLNAATTDMCIVKTDWFDSEIDVQLRHKNTREWRRRWRRWSKFFDDRNIKILSISLTHLDDHDDIFEVWCNASLKELFSNIEHAKQIVHDQIWFRII